MAKAIKRVGVIFLAVAIICLMAIGVLLGATSAKSDTAGSLNWNNEIENVSETSEVEMPPISEEVLLDGVTCDEQAAKWKEAIEKSLANGGGKHILVTMTKDWVAPNSGNHNFGEGVGFSEGRINVPAGAIITLDLNGNAIDRKLTSAIANGSVFFINGGSFILMDNCYDSSKIFKAYKESDKGEVDLSNYTTGRITGGFNSNVHWNQPGGGIDIEANSYFQMNSGMICANQSTQGGGIYAIDAKVVINDGLINNNVAKSDQENDLGGGILSHRTDFTINDGIFHKNLAEGPSGDGGAVYVMNTDKGSVNGGTFANNQIIAFDTGTGLGAGIAFANCNDYLMQNVTIEYNRGDYGGASANWKSSLTIKNSFITNNFAENCGGIAVHANAISTKLENTIVTNNISPGTGGIGSSAPVTIGPGVQIYNNLGKWVSNDNCVQDDFHIGAQGGLIIDDLPLIANGATTRIGITLDRLDTLPRTFTTNYGYGTKHGGNPNRYFFANQAGLTIAIAGTEAQVVSGTQTTSRVTWKWGESSAEQSNIEGYVKLEYKQGGYNISLGNGAQFFKNIDPSHNVSGNSFNVEQAGSYAFFVEGNYLNPTFMVIIEEPKTKIKLPNIKEYKLLYNGELQSFYPKYFDSNTMEMGFNRAKEIGDYTAIVKLKDIHNTVWDSSENNDSIKIKFKIIPRGIEGKENSGYELICMENGYRKSYSESEYEHLINDKEIATINGETRYVLGNISVGTSVKTLIENLRNESNKIKIYNNNKLIYDGITSNGVVDDSLKNIPVATGFKIEYYWDNKLYDIVYLSVLGDVVADAVINTLDVTFINRIAKGEIKLEDLSIEQQLAAMVDNKGKVTSTDGKILLNVIGGNTQTNGYFDNVVQKDKYQLLNLKEEGGKTFRENIDITIENLVNTAIIGNIAPNTKASDFKTKLATQLGVDVSTIAIHKANGVIANGNDFIGTGYYINYNGNTTNKIYLSVLGDLTGDGVVNTLDVTYLNRIIGGNVKLNTNDNIKDKLTMLSALIQNKGNITTADSESIWNYIGGIVDMTKYF